MITATDDEPGQFTRVKVILFACAVPIPLDARILAIYSRMSAVHLRQAVSRS